MANQYDFIDLMKAGGYNPMDGGITTQQMQDFRLQGLINNNKALDQKINALNLPPVQEPNPQEELLKKQRRANMLMAVADAFKGNDIMSGYMQRQAGFDAQKERAERQAKQEEMMKAQQEFMRNLDPNSDLAQKIKVNQLFGFTPSSPPQNKTTKSDFVVEILEKMKNIPGYKLTGTDQRILDTISDTDPMKIIIRNRLNERQGSEFTNQNTNQSGPVTVTTAEQFDSLPKGTKYIYNGTEYIKGQ